MIDNEPVLLGSVTIDDLLKHKCIPQVQGGSDWVGL